MLLGVIDTNWMQWIPCIKIQCRGFNEAVWNASRVNAVDSLQCGPMDPDWMQWIPWSMIECTGSDAALWNASRVNEVESMQRDWMPLIPCRVANVSQLNAVYSMQHCAMDPDGMQRIHAMWPKGTWLNAGDPMQHYWMQWILCRVVQCISIIEMYSMPLDVIDTDSMEWIPCSVTECTGFHAAVWNASRVNAVDCMQLGPMNPDWMHWNPCSVAQWILIECSGFQAAWSNAVDSMQSGAMYLDWMKWIPCSLV